MGCVVREAEQTGRFVFVVFGDGDGADDCEDKDYVEDAPDMREERLVSTLSNLLPHGCVVSY